MKRKLTYKTKLRTLLIFDFLNTYSLPTRLLSIYALEVATRASKNIRITPNYKKLLETAKRATKEECTETELYNSLLSVDYLHNLSGTKLTERQTKAAYCIRYAACVCFANTKGKLGKELSLSFLDTLLNHTTEISIRSKAPKDLFKEINRAEKPYKDLLIETIENYLTEVEKLIILY